MLQASLRHFRSFWTIRPPRISPASKETANRRADDSSKWKVSRLSRSSGWFCANARFRRYKFEWRSGIEFYPERLELVGGKGAQKAL